MTTFYSSRPQALLNAFKKAIADGDITTWEEDSDGDFTHKASQWARRAWLRPSVQSGTSLTFDILFADGEQEKQLVYSYYQGHVILAFLTHFHTQLTEARAEPSF